MAVDDGCECSGNVAVRFDCVELAGFDERRDDSPVLGACVVAGEERVFALQRDGADCALDGVAVNSP